MMGAVRQKQNIPRRGQRWNNTDKENSKSKGPNFREDDTVFLRDLKIFKLVCKLEWKQMREKGEQKPNCEMSC